VFPSMISNHFVRVVDVMYVDVLPTKAASVIEPVSAQPDQIAIERVDAGVGIQLRPIERRGIAEVPVFKKFLALENHRNAGSGEDKRRAECGALSRKPASGVAGPNFLRHARVA